MARKCHEAVKATSIFKKIEPLGLENSDIQNILEIIENSKLTAGELYVYGDQYSDYEDYTGLVYNSSNTENENSLSHEVINIEFDNKEYLFDLDIGNYIETEDTESKFEYSEAKSNVMRFKCQDGREIDIHGKYLKVALDSKFGYNTENWELLINKKSIYRELDVDEKKDLGFEKYETAFGPVGDKKFIINIDGDSKNCSTNNLRVVTVYEWAVEQLILHNVYKYFPNLVYKRNNIKEYIFRNQNYKIDAYKIYDYNYTRARDFRDLHTQDENELKKLKKKLKIKGVKNNSLTEKVNELTEKLKLSYEINPFTQELKANTANFSKDQVIDILDYFGIKVETENANKTQEVEKSTKQDIKNSDNENNIEMIYLDNLGGAEIELPKEHSDDEWDNFDFGGLNK